MSAAKKIILLLWLVVASFVSASALTPGAAETRVWQKSFAPLESRQAEALQTAGLHQRNAGCGYELAPESLLAAKTGTQGKSVLGHYPAYKDLAEQLGARRFNIPTEHWNKMSSAEQWAANQKFLDRMVARGDDVILATPLDKVKPGSFFERELQYLQSKGFKPSADGTRMIPGGGN